MTIVCVALLGGCQTAPADGRMPDEFALSLYTSDAGLRITYFELDRAGLLSFAGGAEAPTRSVKPLVTLTVEQRRDIWGLIVKHRLHEVSGSLFPHGERVTYEFVLKTGRLSLGHSIGAADDEVPGLKVLHDHLMKLRAAVPLTSPVPG